VVVLVSASTPSPRRTNVYVDAFNLYFGCLKGTPYKWLNVAEMCRRSLPSHYSIQRIRYFTARIQARPTDPQQADRQDQLLRALQTIPNLTLHYGRFLASKPMMLLATPLPDGTRFVQVMKTEEKGSDVNLATHLLVDAFDNDFDAAVVISDDSDLAEPIRVVRQKFRRHVTVLSPRGKSRQLSLAATRFYRIQPTVLQVSQFPATLTDGIGTFTKPVLW
jgi:uncharacterized LabA/DUF88 family protein